MQQKVRPGKPVAIMCSVGADRCGTGTRISFSQAIEQISIEGGRTFTRSPGVSAGYGTSQGMGAGGSSSTRRNLPLNIGTNTVTITWSCTVGEPGTDPSISETYFSRWMVEKTFQVEVVAEPEPLVTWSSDPDLSLHFTKHMRISRIAPQIDEFSPLIYVSVSVDAPPVAVAMDVLLLVEGAEKHLFYLTTPAGAGSHEQGGAIRLETTPADAIVVLRPSDDALGVLETDEAFGEELTFPITITWPDEE